MILYIYFFFHVEESLSIMHLKNVSDEIICQKTDAPKQIAKCIFINESFTQGLDTSIIALYLHQ